MKYEVDIKKSLWETLLPHKRHEKRIALIELYLSHFQTMNNEFVQFVDETRERVNISCETIVLEWFLNKKFDPDFENNWPNTKRIYIQSANVTIPAQYSWLDIEATEEEISYTKAEENEAYFEPEFSFLQSEGEEQTGNTVYYPASMMTANQETK